MIYQPKTQALDVVYAVPVFKIGAFSGLAVFTVDMVAINAIITGEVQLGISAQTLVSDGFGQNHVYLANGRIDQIDVLPDFISRQSSSKGSYHFTDVEFVGHSEPFILNDRNAVLLQAISEQDLGAVASNITRKLSIVGLLGALISCGLIWLITSRLLAPLSVLADKTHSLASGDTDISVPETTRRDEIGAMNSALKVLVGKVRENIILQGQQKAMQEAQDAQHKAFTTLVAGFSDRMASLMDDLRAGSVSLGSVSHDIIEVAADADRKGREVAQESGSTVSAIEQVETAANALRSSIALTMKDVNETARVINMAETESQMASTKISSLSDAALKIGEVVQLITDIAEQTDLLALNATIEAARAGDAGKGFAVVATEVKNLANQTGKATQDIKSQISSIQNVTQDTVHVIERINKTMVEVNSYTKALVVAISDQQQHISDIAHNARNAADNAKKMSSAAGHLQENLQKTHNDANSVEKASSTMGRRISALEETFANFKGKLS